MRVSHKGLLVLAALAALSAAPLVMSPCMATSQCGFCRTECYHCVEGFGACVTRTGAELEKNLPVNCHLCPLCRLCVLCGVAQATCDAPLLWVGACAAPLLLALLGIVAMRRRRC
jgi:hypothetical protein